MKNRFDSVNWCWGALLWAEAKWAMGKKCCVKSCGSNNDRSRAKNAALKSKNYENMPSVSMSRCSFPEEHRDRNRSKYFVFFSIFVEFPLILFSPYLFPTKLLSYLKIDRNRSKSIEILRCFFFDFCRISIDFIFTFPLPN